MSAQVLKVLLDAATKNPALFLTFVQNVLDVLKANPELIEELIALFAPKDQ